MSCSLLPVPERPVLRESGVPQGREGRQALLAYRARRALRAALGRKERRDLRAPMGLEALREPLARKERRARQARAAR